MKLFVLITMFLGSVANADVLNLQKEVLIDLVAKASQITLVDEEGQALEEGMQLPALISTALLQNYNQSSANLLSSTNVTCKSVDGGTRVGANMYDCQVSIGNGTFRKNRNGNLVGPSDESSVVIKVRAVRAIYPNAKAKITNTTASAYIAG
jgi:hypothetical protein